MRIFFISLLLVLDNCQRGDGGGRRTSGSNFRSYHNSSTKSEPVNYFVASIIAIIVILISTFIEKKKQFKNKKDKLELIEAFINNNMQCDVLQLQGTMEKIRNQTWKMGFIQNFKFQSVFIHHLDIQIISDYGLRKNPHIKLVIECSDVYGHSCLEGIIKCSEQQLTIFMIKDYKNKQLAQQKGDYSILIYEGQSNNIDDGIYGKWYFYHQQQSSGVWMWKK